MSKMDNFDVERFRDPNQSRTAWRIKKRFLEAHYDKFPEERLICLAQCFLNVQMDGCRYPAPVMAQLNELARDLPEEVEEQRKKVKSKYAMNFVKASESGNAGASSAMTDNQHIRTDNERVASVLGELGFVKSDTEYHSTDILSSEYQIIEQTAKCPSASKRAHFDIQPMKPMKTSKMLGGGSATFKGALKVFQSAVEDRNRDDLSEKFLALGKTVCLLKKPGKNAIEVLHMAVDKVKMTIQHNISAVNSTDAMCFQCDLKIDFVDVSTGKGSNKKNAKHNAYEIACQNLLKPHQKVVQVNPEKRELQSSDTCNSVSRNLQESQDLTYSLPRGENKTHQVRKGKKNRKRTYDAISKDTSEFMIMEFAYIQNNAMTVLRQSADFSKMLLEYDFQPDSDGVKCRLSIEGQPIVECIGTTKQNSKSVASNMALEILKQTCWTIRIKQAADTEGSSISKDEVLGDMEKQMTAIPDSNVGNKLLRMMGWVGGGVGKDSSGIAEPVSLEQVVNREGLGLNAEKGISVDFKSKIRDCVESYARSDRQDDLVFAPDLRKEERALVHQHCQRIGLKSRSYGAGEERYLIVSRKRSAAQLFEHIATEGGSTSKYEIIPPSD